MPPHRERLDRLDETAGWRASCSTAGRPREGGEHVIASSICRWRRARLSPRAYCSAAARATLLELAARYADHVDLAPPSHRKGDDEFQRPLLTTVDDLVGRSGARRGRARR